MSPERLHPSLGASPSAKPICAGCGATDDGIDVLVPVNGSKTLFLCSGCAGKTWSTAFVEVLRRAGMAMVDAIAPQVPA